MKLSDIKTALEIIEYAFKVFSLFKKAFTKLKQNKTKKIVAHHAKTSNDNIQI